MGNLINQQWGNYQLLRLLGRGGFAEVYLGEHVHLGMFAAIKILHAFLSEEDTRAFQQEARIISELAHPHIIRVLDFATREGKPFLVLEYAPHGSLSQKHPRGTRVPLSSVVAYVAQIASALQYAHEKNLIHRDIKPENLLIDQQGHILLSDFGIATMAHATSSMSTDSSVGTLAYMPPEQIQGHPRAASDQYALAVVVYQWLAGTMPFQGSAVEIIAQQLMVAPRPLREHIPQLPAEVAQVVHTALDKDPKARFGSVLAFARALQQAALSESSLSQLPLPISPQPHLFEPVISVQPSPAAPAHAAVPFLHTPAAMPALPITQPAETDSNTATPEHTQAVTPISLASELPTSSAQNVPVTPQEVLPLAQATVTAPRRVGSRRAGLLLTAICILLFGSAASLWYAFTLAQHQTTSNIAQSISTPTTAKMKTAGAPGTPTTGVTPTPSPTPMATPVPTATATSMPIVAPANQAAAPTPTSKPALPAPDPGCVYHNDAGFSNDVLNYSGIAGTSFYTNTPGVIISNCQHIAAHWTVTSQIETGSGWLTCSPGSGDLAAYPGGMADTPSATVTISIVNNTALPAGTYTAKCNFAVSSSGVLLKSFTVQVILTLTSVFDS